MILRVPYRFSVFPKDSNVFQFLRCKIIEIELKIKLHHSYFLGILPMPTKFMKGVSSRATQNTAIWALTKLIVSV